MNKNNIAYENKRLNGPRHKQSYVNYIAFLLPKIWEIPEVRLSPYIKYTLARREIMLLNRDIRETEFKINKLKSRFKYLQERSLQGVLFKDEKDELSRITITIKRQGEWLSDLKDFHKTLSENFPEQNGSSA